MKKKIEDIEIMKLQNLSSQKKNIYLEEEYDEINPKDMSDSKDSDEIEQIRKNDEVRVSDTVEDLKVRKFSQHKYVGNVETESDKINLVDMSDEKDYVEIYEISKNGDVTLTDIDEESEEIYQIN